MTAPIPVYKNSTIAGARRVERGAFRLSPTPQVKAIVLYLFVHYAEKYNIRLLTLVIMSNHLHWVVDDPDGNYPQFLSALYSRLTEVLNDYHGFTGPMWQNCKPQRTRLLDDETIERKLLYAATNASWHGIEYRSRRWDGFCFSPEDVGKTFTVECPQYLLENYRVFPETHTFTVPKPACYSDMTDAQVRRYFRKKRAARERTISCERDEPYLGTHKALDHAPDHEPAEPDDPRDLQNLVFEGATVEATEAGLTDLCCFRGAYRAAREEFVAGNRNVEWPRGAWAMTAWHGCPHCPD